MTKEKSKTAKCTLEEIRCAIAAIEDKKGKPSACLMCAESPRSPTTLSSRRALRSHVKALKSELDQALKEADVQLIGQDRTIGSGWLVVDAFDFMIHLQTPEMRDFYRLDQLWKDATEVSF